MAKGAVARERTRIASEREKLLAERRRADDFKTCYSESRRDLRECRARVKKLTGRGR